MSVRVPIPNRETLASETDLRVSRLGELRDKGTNPIVQGGLEVIGVVRVFVINNFVVVNTTVRFASFVTVELTVSKL